MYINNKIADLYQYVKNTLDKSHSDVTNKTIFFQACIACNYLLDLTGTNLIGKEDKIRINAYFNKVQDKNECWYYEDVYFFGNTQNILDARKVYQLAYSLNYYASEHSTSNKELTTAVLNTLINALFVLIKKDITFARHLDVFLSKSFKIISDRYSFEKIRFNFMHNLIEYIATKDNTILLKQFDFLKFEGLLNLESGFKTAYDQINDIYFHK